MTALANIGPIKLDRTRQPVRQVFEALRESIVSVRLTPGTVLRRTELAEHFGTSQAPVRDALLQLGNERQGDIYAQHATVVSRIDLSAVLRAHFLRRLVELEILAVLCGLADDRHVKLMLRLGANLLAQQAALDPLDLAVLAVADQSFHEMRYQAAGVGPLWTLVRRHSGHVDRLRRLNLPDEGKPQSIVRDHRAIAEALGRRQKTDASEALRRHLAGTLSFVDDIRRRFPDWVVAWDD